MSELPDNPTDHDLLIRIDERTKKIDSCLSGHLARHWMITAGAGLALMGAGISLLVALVGKC